MLLGNGPQVYTQLLTEALALLSSNTLKVLVMYAI